MYYLRTTAPPVKLHKLLRISSLAVYSFSSLWYFIILLQTSVVGYALPSAYGLALYKYFALSLDKMFRRNNVYTYTGL